MQSLAFYWTLYRTALRACAEYRVDFIVGLLTAAVTQLAALSFYWIVFAHTPGLGGWSAQQVLFVFGLAALILGFSELLFNGVWHVGEYIVAGEFDRLLVYPVRTLLFMLTSRPELRALGNVAAGAALVGWSSQRLELSLWVLGLAPFWGLCGAVVYTSALVLMACLSMLAVGPSTQHYHLVYHLLNAARFPISIYPGAMRFIMLFVLPLGAATYLPARWSFGAGSSWLGLLAPPLAALGSGFVAFRAWELAMSRYQSTGS